MDLLDIITIGILAGGISFLLSSFLIFRLFGSFIEDLHEHFEELEDDVIIDSYIDFNEDSMIMYRKDNNEFIAQGRSWDELNKNTIERFPDLKFNVVTSDIEKAKVFGK